MIMKHSPTYSATLFHLIGAVALAALCSCGTPQPFYQSGSDSRPDTVATKQVDQEIFLIGDTGDPVLYGTDPVLTTLQYQLERASDSSAVVFLGDNIYPDGMNPDTTYQARKEDVAIITRNLQTLHNYPGHAFFTPGNHDWRHDDEGIRAQERFIESYGQADAEFVPDNACPGPDGFEIGSDWYLIILDSQWWINESYTTLTDVAQCETTTRVEVMNTVANMVEEHDDRKTVIAFHHTLYGNGPHGGYYSFRDYVFPLTNVVENLWLPLPLIGSIYPIYRKLGRSGQDIEHQRYEEFAREILEAVEDRENIFFASGHEHSLGFYQYEKKEENGEGTHHFVLSGSGSKTTYARTGYGAEFVYSEKGFAKIVSYTDGSVTVEYWTPHAEQPEGELVYFNEIIAPEAERTLQEQISYRRKQYAGAEDSVRTLQADPQLAAGPLHRVVWGDHYRDAWTAEVEVPVFNMDTKKGGLEVLEVTGGEQTATIIVQDSSKNRYVMRSVQKNPAQSLPDALQETFVKDLAQDQVSASHPYGVLAVPPLAAAAGVYHTNPEIGFLSRKSGIKLDIGDRPGLLVNFQEFVSADWFNKQYDKRAVDMVDSDELWERLRMGGDVRINQEQLVRSRIFDMFIGDWDRHEGQWFWAETRTDSISVFEPIPIDRDNAFFKSDGAIPWLARRKWALRKFQLFDEGIRDIKGMNFNARHFDRWFMNELPRKQWLAIAEEMQAALTDSVIEAAISKWPETIQELNGATFKRKLKARRAKLTDFAARYYDVLSEEVNVYGSDGSNIFEVSRSDSGKTTVAVYEEDIDEAPKPVLRYERTFRASETEEIRLFGFGEDDVFNVSGHSREAPALRIVGGEGPDLVNDQSSVEGISEKTVVYDTHYGVTIRSAGEVQSKTSDDPHINRFEDRAFEYNLVAPLVIGGYNSDDGVFLGGGALIKTHAFRKQPFAAKHYITAKRSLHTSSFTFSYSGQFTNEVGPFDLTLDADVMAPRFVNNYFGLGNETETPVEDLDYYNYKIDNFRASAGVSEALRELLYVDAELGYEYFRPIRTPGRFITSPQSMLSRDDFGRYHFATLGAGLRVSTVDSDLIPQYGVEFKASGGLNYGLNSRSETFTRFSSSIKLYNTFENITTTTALQVGLATNIGDYNFFQANVLGGQGIFTEPGNLRGYPRNRFAGRTSFYHNLEVRTKIGNISSYLFPAKYGLSAFVDGGRVWTDGAESRLWHVGYGGGLWISPLSKIVLSGNYARSEEGDFYSVTLGFNF